MNETFFCLILNTKLFETSSVIIKYLENRRNCRKITENYYVMYWLNYY